MQFNVTSMECKIILKPWQDDDASNISNDAKNRHKSLHHPLNHNAGDGHGHGHGLGHSHGHGSDHGPGCVLSHGHVTLITNVSQKLELLPLSLCWASNLLKINITLQNWKLNNLCCRIHVIIVHLMVMSLSSSPGVGRGQILLMFDSGGKE